MNTPDYPPDFEIFWMAWPQIRRVAKGTALKAWQKLKPDAEFQAKILDAVKKQAKQWAAKGTEARYIPHPSTWLNGARWDDVVDVPAMTKPISYVCKKCKKENGPLIMGYCKKCYSEG